MSAIEQKACIALVLLSTALHSAAVCAGAPQAFSADIVQRDSQGAAIGVAAKLRVSGDRTRIDTPDAAGGYFLTDAAAGTVVFVRTAQHVFMDAKQSTPLTRIFVRVDPRDPCRQWEAAALIAGGVTAATWRCDTTRESAVIDPALEFPIQWRTPDGRRVVLENIRLEPQPSELLAIPEGYRKFDPAALVERIKHSDVWVPASDRH